MSNQGKVSVTSIVKRLIDTSSHTLLSAGKTNEEYARMSYALFRNQETIAKRNLKLLNDLNEKAKALEMLHNAVVEESPEESPELEESSDGDISTRREWLSRLNLSKEDQERSMKKKFPQLSIAGIIRKRKLDDTSKTMAFLLISLVLSMLLSFLNVVNWGTIQIALFMPIVLLYVSQITLDYRILKGFYGNNEREAREIIEFIVKESSGIDFTDHGKPKKILSDANLEEIKQEVIQTLPGVA
jgi:hypothetical protein